MKAVILFTRSPKIGSKLIQAVTGEPVSHCAIYVPCFGTVWHSTVPCIINVPYDDFIATHDVVYTVDADIGWDQISEMNKLFGRPYDMVSLLLVGLRLLATRFKIPFPKIDLRSLSGMYLCTEFVSDIMLSDIDSYITPYKLYLKLKGG